MCKFTRDHTASTGFLLLTKKTKNNERKQHLVVCLSCNLTLQSINIGAVILVLGKHTKVSPLFLFLFLQYWTKGKGRRLFLLLTLHDKQDSQSWMISFEVNYKWTQPSWEQRFMFKVSHFTERNYHVHFILVIRAYCTKLLFVQVI